MSSVILVGKPNSGKSLLFNRLTGVRQKVANFPGVTVDLKTGKFDEIQVTDFPGTYSFTPLTSDEKVAVSAFQTALVDDDVRLIVCLLDATRLERSLVLGLQAQAAAHKHNKPLVFALNMIDEIEANNAKLDISGLESELGSPVFPISARTEKGVAELKSALTKWVSQPNLNSNFNLNANTEANSIFSRARELNEKFGPKSEILLKKQNLLDRIFLSNTLGGLFFISIMFVLFQSIFTWAAPFMDFVEETIVTTGNLATSNLNDGTFKDFINDAIFGGFGSFLVFVPQIFFLTFIIGLLEDSGYLARAAVLCHKPFSYFGMSGRSFVPLLTGHACAIPAMFAARTMESPKKRLLTLLTIPLMGCSARLPVYALLIAALIPRETLFGGLIGLQGAVFFGAYFLGIALALILSGILSKTVYKSNSDSPFVIELPPYRLPNWRPLFFRSVNASKTFITKAGAIIFSVTVIVWILGYFPNGSGALDTSILASLGRAIEPIFEPIGLDWRYGVAVLASFLAREVFVGTLGTLFGIESADEDIEGLATQLGASGLTLASGVALLVFYAIALQCVSTVAMLKKEIGNWKLPLLTTLGYGVLAYVLALFTYWALV